MKVIIPISGGVVCFIISYFAFHNDEDAVGWLFFLGGLLIVVLGIVFGSKSKKSL